MALKLEPVRNGLWIAVGLLVLLWVALEIAAVLGEPGLCFVEGLDR